MEQIEKKIVIKYRKSDLEEKKVYPCPVYICVNGTSTFTHYVHFSTKKLLKIICSRQSDGPIVVDYDEVMK